MAVPMVNTTNATARATESAEEAIRESATGCRGERRCISELCQRRRDLLERPDSPDEEEARRAGCLQEHAQSPVDNEGCTERCAIGLSV